MRFPLKARCSAPMRMTPSRSITLAHSDRTPWGKAALIFAFVSLLYFCTRSPGLDEWDLVQFALGVGNFNIWEHQPHPPGYPLYVFCGWIAQTLFHLDPVLSLQTASCLGGGLFVAAWFLIVRLDFGDRFAWLVAVSLGVTPIVWMTSTNTMTDSLATGLLSGQLLCALFYRRKGSAGSLFGAAFLGAASAGVRPQLFAVVLAVMVLALVKRRAPLRTWFFGVGGFLGGCLLWLLPMWYLQARLRPEIPAWTVYPTLVYGQWRWRLDRPAVYIGAGNWSLLYLGERFGGHILGWLSVGLGFIRSVPTMIAGSLLVLTGTASFSRHFDATDREFWRTNRAWAALHVVIIFCCLPAAQRYTSS